MKHTYIYILAFLFVLYGCGGSNDNQEEAAAPEVTVDSGEVEMETDQGMTIVNKPSLWTVEFENSSQKEKLHKPEGTNIESLSPNDLVSLLNQSHEEIPLQFEKISHDTLYAKISNSQYLTQQIGSTGAYNYLASVVYNLTELPNVKYVKLDFDEGDHAAPGVYTREDFKTLR